jgi:hypothetical protein
MLCSTSGQDVRESVAAFNPKDIVKQRNSGVHMRCPECHRMIPLDGELRFYRHNPVAKTKKAS